MLLNAVQTKPLYKVGLYAGPGRGKTHIGATAPKPLILLFERHGFETVRTAAKMYGRAMPPVIWVRSAKQLSRIQQILASDQKEPIATMMRDEEVISEDVIMESGIDREQLVKSLPYLKPETVVIDSVTEAGELLANVVDAHGGLATSEGLTFRKMNAWGPIVKKCTVMIRRFRDLPYHVLFLALVDERNLGSEDEPDIHFRPAVPGRQLWKTLTASVNAMGVVQMKHIRDEKTKKLETKRWVQFITGANVCSKVAHPLRAREPADAGVWFAALEHGVKSTSPAEELVAVEDELPVLGNNKEGGEEATEEKKNDE